MSNNFNDPFAANLIGLWDFLSSGKTEDTGLADGVAQNGHLEGGASVSGGRLHTDGNHDWFDVEGGNDAPFNLSEGTVAAQFTQHDHVGSSPDMIVNRGEYDDREDEGWFGLSVTKDGKVQVEHHDNGDCAVLSTNKKFFDEGDTVKAVYSWSQNDGLTLTVENLTQGTSTTVTSAKTGLTMAVTDNDDESWTFAAREEDDGDYDKFFDGQIDYVAIYDRDIQSQGDGVVSGSSGDDLIDAGYTGDPEGDVIDGGDAVLPGEGPDDDIVDAGDGDDTIEAGAGDDDVYAGGGSDSVEGGAGDDLVYGDGELDGGGPSTTVRESFEWDEIPDTDGGSGDVDDGDPLDGGITQNTGNVDVTFSVLSTTGPVRTEFADNQQKVHSITDDGAGVDRFSSMASELDGSLSSATYEWSFTKPVENVSFRINDIDGDGVVKVFAYDADGNKVPLDIQAGSKLDASDADGVGGTEILDSKGNYEDDTSPNYSALVNIAGPVTRIEVQHSEDGPNNSGINVTDMYFDVETGPVPGDDTILGGLGEDTLLGEAGDDVLDGGDGDDDLSGGDGSDSVSGGAGDDVIDTSGSTEVNDYETFAGVPFETGAAQLNDLDTVDGGAGDDTITTGDDADSILGGAGDDSIDGGIDDDTIEGGTGDDFIDGGLGSDSILGGDGDDTIEAGINAFSDYVGDDPNLPNPMLIDPATGLPATSDPNPDDGRDFVDGGAGDDVINTGDDADTILGGEGDDTINAGIDDDLVEGNDGDDSITGSHGSDTISGGDGDDTIWGGFGNGPDFGLPGEVPDAVDPVPQNGRDELDGGAGDDLIYGEDDDDTLIGGTGDDTLDGGVDDDSLLGGEGDDSLIGGQGDDTAIGGAGDDVIETGTGTNLAEGGAGEDTITGAGDNDVLRGGDDADTFFLLPAGAGVRTVTIYGDAGGDDNDTLDLTSLTAGGFTITSMTKTPENNGNPGFDGQAQLVNSGTGETLNVDFFDIENVIPCFTPGTVIATPKGERLVEELREGDRIITRDNGIQEIRWLGRRDLEGRELLQAPHLKPVLIRAGSLGNGLPERDMVVSPNHRVLMNNEHTALYFEDREVLAAAKHLTGLKGVDAVEASAVSYIHFMFDRHEVVLSNGAWTESFQPGEQTMDGMGQAQRDEIYHLFPELREAEGLKSYQAARRSLKKHEAMLLAK